MIKLYDFVIIKKQCYWALLLLSVSSLTFSASPQENILNLMIDLQTDREPISLVRYEGLTRSEKIEHRIYLEQSLAGSAGISNDMKESILRQYDDKIGEKGENGGMIIGGLTLPRLPMTAAELPANEMNYLKSLANGSPGAAGLRRVILKAKALGYSSTGVGAGQSLVMANTYLTLSTETIAIGSGIPQGEIRGVIAESLNMSGVPLEVANELSDRSMKLAENPKDLEGIISRDLKAGLNINFSTNRELEIGGRDATFGLNKKLDLIDSRRSGSAIQNVGVGLKK
jgi:hypothetical protein